MKHLSKTVGGLMPIGPDKKEHGYPNGIPASKWRLETQAFVEEIDNELSLRTRNPYWPPNGGALEFGPFPPPLDILVLAQVNRIYKEAGWILRFEDCEGVRWSLFFYVKLPEEPLGRSVDRMISSFKEVLKEFNPEKRNPRHLHLVQK